jgi:hypothetical protein
MLNITYLSFVLLCTTSDDQLFFSPYVFIWFLIIHIIYVNVKFNFNFNIHFVDMKGHMLICFFIFMLMD